jgi:hypothetical protein
MSDAPWFRRYFGFSFRPIRWEGWALTAAFVAAEVPILWLSLNVAAESPLWWVCAALGLATLMLFWWVVLGKMES